VPDQIPGDDPDEGPTIGRADERDLAGADVLVARRRELLGGGQVDPELEAVEQAAGGDEPFRGLLDVEDAGAGRHPLRVAVGDDAAAPIGVGVLEGPVDHVRDGLEAAVRMPGRPLGLARRVLDLAHLVEMDEGVEVGQVDAGERPPDREALALVPLRGHRHAGHGALAGKDRVRFRDSRQDGDVVDGDGGHGVEFLTGGSGPPPGGSLEPFA